MNGKSAFEYEASEFVLPASSSPAFVALGKALSTEKPEGKVFYINSVKECPFGIGYGAVYFPCVKDEEGKLGKAFKSSEK